MLAREASTYQSCEALSQGGAALEQEPPATEDHVWFEDRWMVASLCDE
jgi:hypothetical protein